MDCLCQKLETLLKARQINVPVSFAQIQELVSNNNRIKNEEALQELARLVLAGRSLPV